MVQSGGESQPPVRFLSIGQGETARRLAFMHRMGTDGRPPVVWFSGFRSTMRSVKAQTLDAWAEAQTRTFIRFDYSGHGESGGAFEEAGISCWLEDALAIIAVAGVKRPIFVGSSMGGWLALLAARALRETRPKAAPSALVLIAPAVDFTECLIWQGLPEDYKAKLFRDGSVEIPSRYGDGPYPITRLLMEDGRKHCLLDTPVVAGCPIRILHGMKDEDVPWTHAMALVEACPADMVAATFIDDGDHRLSRESDLEKIIAAVEASG